MLILLSFLLLNVKHLFADFLFQRSYQYKNKGTYGHPGGILHAAIHFVLSLIALGFLFPFYNVLLVSTIDFVLHYHIDWAKIKINAVFGLTPTTHEEFWWLLGLDQFLHQLTYIVMIFLLIGL